MSTASFDIYFYEFFITFKHFTMRSFLFRNPVLSVPPRWDWWDWPRCWRSRARRAGSSATSSSPWPSRDSPRTSSRQACIHLWLCKKMALNWGNLRWNFPKVAVHWQTTLPGSTRGGNWFSRIPCQAKLIV